MQMTVWQARTESVEQTMALGRALGRHVEPGDLIALVGELGVGKTQLVRGLAEGMGIDPRAVASPTFVMVVEHEPQGDGPTLVHIDAYRLESLDELESVGWEINGESLRRDGVIALEWADRLDGALGEDLLRVELVHEGEHSRSVTVEAMGNWQLRSPALAASLREAVKQGGDREPRPAIKCPICGQDVSDDAETFPFCSVRCKQVDLAKWFGGDYKISRSIEQSDLDEGE